jgi:hypothetical protein
VNRNKLVECETFAVITISGSVNNSTGGYYCPLTGNIVNNI